jgi:hypothetical protein
MEFETLPIEIETEPEAELQETPQAVPKQPSAPYALIISQILTKLLKLPDEALVPYAQATQLVGFDEALEQVGGAGVLNPKVRVMLGFGILGLGVFLAWRTYGRSGVGGDSGKREKLPVSANVARGSQPTPSVSGVSGGQELEEVLKKARMEVANDNLSPKQSVAGSGGEGSSGPHSVNSSGSPSEPTSPNEGGG